MGRFPSDIFESFRVRATQTQVPVWKVRLVAGVVVLVGLVVFLLLLPLIVFAAALFAAWVLFVRARLWFSGVRRRDDDGRENVRVLVRDA